MADVLSAEEQEVIRKMRAKKEKELQKILRKRERADRLKALRAEVAALEKGERHG